MALSDPSNVQVGLVRKQALLQRLAAQMAAKSGSGPARMAGMVRSAGSRAAGTPAQFASAVNMRAPGTARVTLPFDLPVNRIRPAGFDPDQSGGSSWTTPQAVAPVTPSGPPAGGGTAISSPTPAGGGYSTPDQGIVATTPGADGSVWTPADSGAYTAPSTTPAGTPAPNPQYMSDGSGNYTINPNYDPSAPLNTPAPDPYTLMATAQMQRLMRGGAYAV